MANPLWPESAHASLVRGLLGDDSRNRRLFQTSPEFRATVEILARMLPVWVEGLADQEERNAPRREAMLWQLMNFPPLETSAGWGDRGS